MPPSQPPLLIYLHGFNSSPASHKAQVLRNYFSARDQLQHYEVPELDPVPERAMQDLVRLLDARVNDARVNKANITLLGSSLGGYYASFLVERFGVRVVLVNPAVNPASTLASCVGYNENYYTREKYEFTQEHLRQLAHYEIAGIAYPEGYLVFLQTGDDTLDYREAADKYRHCDLHIEAGGSHGYSGFERIIPRILAFAGIPHLQPERSASVS